MEFRKIGDVAESLNRECFNQMLVDIIQNTVYTPRIAAFFGCGLEFHFTKVPEARLAVLTEIAE